MMIFMTLKKKGKIKKIKKSRKIKKIRKEIDFVDDKIAELLNKRAKLVLDISQEKKKKKEKVYQPEREKEILNRIKKKKGFLSSDSLEAIFQEIISHSRALQGNLRISFLGPRATFTEMAAVKKFGKCADYTPLNSISDVFQHVEREQSDFGVVPIENSSEGSVTSTLDLFFDSNLNICGETVINIDHCLLSNTSLKKVKKIFSHPQALAQCRNWIKIKFPNPKIFETSSTAKAAEMAKKTKNSAAIASSFAAKEYNLKVLAEKIQDRKQNKTRFLIIGKISLKKTGEDKTSILFVTKHKSGALFKTLKPFYDHKINMTKIESRPLKGKLWEYGFFVDIQGHKDDKKVKNALKELSKQVLYLKVLGSYPED